MDFSQKYDLIELLPGEGVQSYRARQTNTGRDVTVHLLMGGGKTPENEEFLVRLRAMPPQSMAKLIEVGDYQGAMFVVTVAPPYQRLDEWLAEQDRAAVAATEFGKAGIWKRPDVGSLAPPPPPVQPAKGPGRTGRVYETVSAAGLTVVGHRAVPGGGCSAPGCLWRGKGRIRGVVFQAGKRDRRAGRSPGPGAGMAIGTGRIYEDVSAPGCSAGGTCRAAYRCGYASDATSTARASAGSAINGTWRVHEDVRDTHCVNQGDAGFDAGADAVVGTGRIYEVVSSFVCAAGGTCCTAAGGADESDARADAGTCAGRIYEAVSGFVCAAGGTRRATASCGHESDACADASTCAGRIYEAVSGFACPADGTRRAACCGDESDASADAVVGTGRIYEAVSGFACPADGTRRAAAYRGDESDACADAVVCAGRIYEAVSGFDCAADGTCRAAAYRGD